MSESNPQSESEAVLITPLDQAFERIAALEKRVAELERILDQQASYEQEQNERNA